MQIRNEPFGSLYMQPSQQTITVRLDTVVLDNLLHLEPSIQIKTVLWYHYCSGYNFTTVIIHHMPQKPKEI